MAAAIRLCDYGIALVGWYDVCVYAFLGGRDGGGLSTSFHRRRHLRPGPCAFPTIGSCQEAPLRPRRRQSPVHVCLNVNALQSSRNARSAKLTFGNSISRVYDDGPRALIVQKAFRRRGCLRETKRARLSIRSSLLLFTHTHTHTHTHVYAFKKTGCNHSGMFCRHL